MIKTVLYCALYALLNVSGVGIIKYNLKDRKLAKFDEWLSVLLNVQVIGAFVLIFLSMLVIFKALASANFTFVVPVSTGINFILTVIAGVYIFKDQLNLMSFVGFTLIISGILLLSLNSTQHATQ